MDKDTVKLLGAAALGIGVGFVASRFFASAACRKCSTKYSTADQFARAAGWKATNCKRALDIDAFFDGSALRGKRVLVTGTNRGIGLALVKQLHASGATVFATCRKPSDALRALDGINIITGVDVCKDACMGPMVEAVTEQLDMVINNAGYFYEPFEPLSDLKFDEESKMIEICAVGMLRVTAALWNGGKIKRGGKVIMITSQGGSVEWRETQNPKGGDYGHHMSKAAANIMGKLVAQELKGQVDVGIFHPGFNRTEMTAKYTEAYDSGGAVDTSVGAKRVLHEALRLNAATSGQFINCEDGLQIPW